MNYILLDNRGNIEEEIEETHTSLVMMIVIPQCDKQTQVEVVKHRFSTHISYTFTFSTHAQYTIPHYRLLMEVWFHIKFVSLHQQILILLLQIGPPF